MPQMTDMEPALASFQEELSAGRLIPPPTRSFTDPMLRMFVDNSGGEMRMTFTRIDPVGTVTAFLTAVRNPDVDGLPCFTIGYAVPKALRGQGRASEILSAVLNEFSHGFKEAGKAGFAVEAVVSVDNLASQAVARKALTDAPASITDSVSGEPALYYVRKVALV